VSFTATGATALRVLVQLRRDPRTIALIVAVPCVLETLLKELFKGDPAVFSTSGHRSSGCSRSSLLPLTYAYEALAKVAAGGPYGARFALDVAVILGSILVALALGAATLRRRTG
jgi:hypothetical protein